MPSATSRFAPSALLLLGSAVVAVALAVTTTPRFASAKIPPLDSLPWSSVARVQEPRAPVAVLYVQSGCSHCSPAAAAFDSMTSTRLMVGIIMTSDSAPAADAYRKKLSLRRPIALDSSKAMLHALQIRSVPTLIAFSRDGTRRVVVGFRDARAYARLLRALE